MVFALLRSSEQHKLRRMLPRQTLDEFEVALFAPLLELLTTSRARIQSDDHAGEINTQPLEVHAAASAFFFREFEHVAVLDSGGANNLQHQVLVSSGTLSLEVIEDAHFEPFTRGWICGPDTAPLVQNKAILLFRIRHAG